MRSMKLKICLALFIAVAFFSINPITAAGLHDDFSKSMIDSDKWSDLEFVRKIDSTTNKMVLKVRTSGTASRNRTLLAQPDTVNAIKAKLALVETEITGNHRVEAYVGGFFYNDRASGGATGDIWADVSLENNGGGLVAEWTIWRALDDELNNFSKIGGGQLFAPGQLNYGTQYLVQIVYDGANKFTFKVSNKSATANGPTRQRISVTKNKGFHLGVNADTDAGEGYISATVDDVIINNAGSIFDDFSSALLNPSKWQTLEFVREICNGKLCLIARGYHETSRSQTYLIDKDKDYLEAKVLVEQGSVAPSGYNTAIGRIGGSFYNDSHGPGGVPYNGYEGNVYGFVRLLLENGKLKAVASVWRADNADGNTGPSPFWEEFSLPIQFDTFYTLSIKFTGSEFLFKCNNEMMRYGVTTPVFPPYSKYRRLEATIWPGSTDSGYIKTQFDDVRITSVNMVPMVDLLLNN